MKVEFTKKKAVHFILLVLSYLLMGRISNGLSSFLTLMIVVSGFLSLFQIFSLMQQSVGHDMEKKRLDKRLIEKRLVIFFLWSLSVLLIKKIGALEFLFLSFDSGTFLFFIFIPFIPLLLLPSISIFILASITWTYATFFSLQKFEKTSEEFIIVNFFLLAAAVIIKIKELILDDKHQYDLHS